MKKMGTNNNIWFLKRSFFNVLEILCLKYFPNKKLNIACTCACIQIYIYYNHLRKLVESNKGEHMHKLLPQNSLLGIFTSSRCICLPKDMYQLLIGVLLTDSPNWEPPKCPS